MNKPGTDNVVRYSTSGLQSRNDPGHVIENLFLRHRTLLEDAPAATEADLHQHVVIIYRVAAMIRAKIEWVRWSVPPAEGDLLQSEMTRHAVGQVVEDLLAQSRPLAVQHQAEDVEAIEWLDPAVEVEVR